MAVMMFLAFSLTVFAQETSEANSETENTYIGVVGKKDFYPYEYYNSKTGEYEGVFPELFEILSDKTGLSFRYVNDEMSDDSEAENMQIISAYVAGDYAKYYTISETIPVVSYEDGENEVSVCIAFDTSAEKEIIGKVTSAMNSVTDEEIISLLGKYISAKSTVNHFAICNAIVVFLIVFIVLVGIQLTRMQKKALLNRRMLDYEMSDSLTGIGNKTYFEKQFEKTVAYQGKASYVIACIGFDIRKVNKYYGDEIAEKQLCNAANMLNEELADKDVVARISGGAFGILHVCSTGDEAQKWANNLVSKLNDGREQLDNDYISKFRAGVYPIPSENWDCAKALKGAQKCYDTAVETDVETLVSDEKMERQLQLDEILIHDLENAFEEHQFVQYFHPFVFTTTEKIVGIEGLARWQHPTLGMLHPSRFVPMMIEDGKIFELDMYLFEESCKKLAMWKQCRKSYLLSTNFDRSSITTDVFVDRIKAIASKYDFIRENLVLEITEEGLGYDKETAMANLKSVKEMGFRISFDDVGSGVVFFSDFKDYPVDIVKLDRSMLLGATDEKGKALMEGMIRICSELGMEIICEGVETHEQCELIREMGCEYIQGYYYYKPSLYEEIEKYL